MEKLSKYIVSINKETGVILLANLNQNKTWFCDYKSTTSKIDLDKAKIGQEVIDDTEELIIMNEIPSKRVQHLLSEYKAYRLSLTKKYSSNGIWSSTLTKEHTPTLKDILDEYYMDRVCNGKDVNMFIADATYLFCKAMGIKARIHVMPDSYERLGFEYPEDVTEIANAIYSYIERKIMPNPIKKTITFYDEKNMENTYEYNILKNWLEEHTHFRKTRFKSNVSMRIKAANENKKIGLLESQISKIEIGPNCIVYHHDGTEKRHITTRVTDEERNEIGFTWSYINSKGQNEKKIS